MTLPAMRRGVAIAADAALVGGTVLVAVHVVAFAALLESQSELVNTWIPFAALRADVLSATVSLLFGLRPYGLSVVSLLLLWIAGASRRWRSQEKLGAVSTGLFLLGTPFALWSVLMALNWLGSPGGVDFAKQRLDVELISEGHLQDLGHALLGLAGLANVLIGRVWASTPR